MSAPICPSCGKEMLDDADGMYGGWICADGHRGQIIYEYPANSTVEPTPMQMIEEMGDIKVICVEAASPENDWAMAITEGHGLDAKADSPEAAIRALYKKWKEQQ